MIPKNKINGSSAMMKEQNWMLKTKWK